MEITKRTAPSPAGEITIFTLVNASGASVELSTLGAGILAVNVPDSNGRSANVVLSYRDPASYLGDGPCLGKVPGRYANRIARGHLEIDGKTYQLNVNNGPNALHGGPTGFQNRIWNASETKDGIIFTYRSEDGEENYPGTLDATVRYRWSDDNTLSLEFSATTDAPTVVNLTNHTYWNLDGADSGSALDHTLLIRADRYIPTDDTLIPTGEKAHVSGTPMDFRTFKRVGEDIAADFPALKYGKGYDAGCLVTGWEERKMISGAVILRAARSGRRLVIDSDQPDAHVYTGNWLDGSPENREGRPYRDYEGIAIEMQGVPDAPNQPCFPTQTLRPGETYRRTIRFHLLTD